MAAAGSFDLNSTLRLGAFDASSHRLLLCGSGGELRMFDTAKWDMEFAKKYSDNEITALNFKNGKIYLAFGSFHLAEAFGWSRNRGTKRQIKVFTRA